MYELVYWTHVICVVVSVAGFLLRGSLMVAGSDLLKHKVVRVLPHVIDTVLLTSALGLAWMLRQYPFTHDWLTVKVVALLVYIGLGMVALRFGKTQTVRTAAFAGALVVVLFMISVAFARHPLGIFAT